MDASDRWAALKSAVRPDRPPISFWRHFYDREFSPDTFAEATIEFQRRFDWDLVKINPRASYQAEPWGVKVTQPSGPLDKPIVLSSPVLSAEDLAQILAIPMSHPVFSAHLQAVAAIRKALPRPLPIVMTIFTPLSVLGDLVPDDATLIRLIGEAPDEVTSALENITKTYSDLAVEYLNAGADGLFFATTEWASSDNVSWKQYEKFGRPYDLRNLAAVSAESTFTVLHVCASNNYMDRLADYPVDVVSWDATNPTNPSLRNGWEAWQKPIIGGLERYKDLLDLPPAILAEKTRRLVVSHADLPLAVGPSCAVPVRVPLENLQVVKDAVIEAAQNQ